MPMATIERKKATSEMNSTASQAGQNGQTKGPKLTIVSSMLTYPIHKRNHGRAMQPSTSKAMLEQSVQAVNIFWGKANYVMN